MIITNHEHELAQKLNRVLLQEHEPSAADASAVACAIVDRIVGHSRLPDDAKRGVLANMIEYAEQQLKLLEPSTMSEF